jgi:hypothetical protein
MEMEVGTPIDAQIDAAAAKMQALNITPIWPDDWTALAKAALAAAAEVGPQERLGPEFEKVLHDNLWELYARDTMTPTDAQDELFHVQCRILDLGTDKSLSAKELRKKLMELRQEIINWRDQMWEHR